MQLFFGDVTPCSLVEKCMYSSEEPAVSIRCISCKQKGYD